MATTLSDKRIVNVNVTRAELATLLGEKAQQAGLINFTPDSVEVFDNGDTGFEIRFEVAT